MNEQGYSIQVDEAVLIRLFMEGSLSLDGVWPDQQARAFLKAVEDYSFEKILEITDSFDYSKPLDTNYVPQFADMDAIDRTVSIIGNGGKALYSYEDLGYYLVRDDKKKGAYRKYGENHGKGAALLGLAMYRSGELRPSCLSDAYNSLPDSDARGCIRNKLFLRIPFIRLTLFKAREERYNAYDSIRMFTLSTMERRGQSPRKIFKELQKCGNPELNRRINNIFWEA